MLQQLVGLFKFWAIVLHAYQNHRNQFLSTISPKNEGEAPGFSHEEESGSDDRRLINDRNLSRNDMISAAIKNNHLRVEAF